ncbi:Protein BTN1 [Paramyrothecium foliicola]|nr:Protein BTN1 [Paramyrothecium foliicola]
MAVQLADVWFLGFVTVTVAPIVYAACYLIVPYPRPIVILIETLPAIAVKFLVPHIIPYVANWLRPIAVAAGLLLASILIDLITPNVHPPVRILMTLLAAAATAASEISFLGFLQHYGKAGLAGWGVGTGAGAIAVAVMPYVLTYRMGLFLRSAVGYTYYLIPSMLIAYYIILPRVQTPQGSDKHSGQDLDIESENGEFLVQSVSASLTFRQRIERNLKLIGSLATPYMVPLLASTAIGGIIFPGVTRAYAISSSFGAYASYFSAYGLAFQLGNMLGRVSAVFARSPKTRNPNIRLCAIAAVIVLNACLLFITIPFFVFVAVFGVGFLCGTIYSNTFAAALEEPGAAAVDREFSMGVIGIGETAGILAGACIGAVLETSFCALSLGDGQRWCHAVR